MKLLLLPNIDKPHVRSCISRLTAMQFSQPVEFLMENKLATRFGEIPGLRFGELEQLMAESDVCIAVGGDGTIIHGGKIAACHARPVLGINLGHLGFLATLESDQLEQIGRLLTGEYTTENRMMLRVTLETPSGVHSWQAMNDAVLSKGGPLNRMIGMSIDNRGRTVGSYRADGLIFSTPTGSTAYAMSAGGPIIDPAINCIAMTPLSPHSLFYRPIVFDDESSLSVCLSEQDAKAYLTIDGEESVPVWPRDRLFIEKSEIAVTLINLTGKSFYDVLNEKLIWRSRK